ncbi:MAG: aspartate carbamoyltransferase, partial [Eubacterium sp.]
YNNVHFILISPRELAVPDYIKSDILDKSSSTYEEVEKMEEVMDRLDILYMTRIQRERFFSEDEYLKHKDAFILDLKKLEIAKKDLTIMHPLPRVNEIATEVDDDPRAKYFVQALNGKYIRMALIKTLLEWGGAL